MVSEMDAETKDKIAKTDAEWRQKLTPEQYKVTRQHGTERAFTGKYWDNHEAGTYNCVCCGEPVFDSASKFDSGTGWPSFYEPARREAVETQTDRTRPACATASTRRRWISTRRNRDRFAAASRKAPHAPVAQASAAVGGLTSGSGGSASATAGTGRGLGGRPRGSGAVRRPWASATTRL